MNVLYQITSKIDFFWLLKCMNCLVLICSTVFIVCTDGKQCGFGFVQFGDVAAAKEAVTKMNTKPIAGELLLVLVCFVIRSQ